MLVISFLDQGQSILTPQWNSLRGAYLSQCGSCFPPLYSCHWQKHVHHTLEVTALTTAVSHDQYCIRFFKPILCVANRIQTTCHIDCSQVMLRVECVEYYLYLDLLSQIDCK